jgi:hypothetical protein
MTQGPPETTTTALLAGGALDGLQMEIDPGQANISVGSESVLYSTADASAFQPALSYRYRGRVTDDGLALFELEE